MNIKKYFPIFQNNLELTYLDNAATTQKPKQVIDAICQYYSNENSNINRGIYTLAENTTQMYEDVRSKVARFINAKSNEIVFNSGTTEGINFVAQAWGLNNVSKGDEIIVTELEHHSNFLPWQRLAEQTGAILKIVPLKNGRLDYNAFEKLITDKTKLIAVTYQSNVTAEILDFDLINKFKKDAKLFIDAAQIVAHEKIDVKKLNCDFLVFSAHKMFGPTGVGVLYINENIQDQVFPYKLGGGMVFEVSKENSSWLQAPHKFEAGTPAIAQVVGLGVTIDFINENINFEQLKNYEFSLSKILVDELKKIEAIEFICDPEYLKKGHIVTFNIKNFHPHDVAAYLDKYGICVRAGHHCAQLLHKSLGLNSSVRVSISVYNTIDDINKIVGAIKELCAF